MTRQIENRLGWVRKGRTNLGLAITLIDQLYSLNRTQLQYDPIIFTSYNEQNCILCVGSWWSNANAVT